MKNRVVIALMLSTMLISGCGKKEVVDSIPQNDVGQVEEIPEDSYKSNDVVYDLKLVDEMPVDRVEQSANEGQPITYEEIQEPESVSDATEKDEVVSVGEEEAVSDTMLDNEVDNLDINININDFVKKIYMPDKFVANINLGIPGMGILIGEADGYKLSGVESCFMWESANGTFYKDAKGVKSVNVDGRSTMFVDNGESKDSDDADGFGMSPNMDIVSSGDFEDLIGNTDEIEFVGQEEFNGIDCFAFTAPATTDDSEDGEVTLYVNSRTGALCGITAEEDGFIMTGNVLDYYEFVGDLEKEVSGSIEDGDATEAVGNGLMGAIFGMLFTGMSGGMTMD